jgi:hypothetical protein
LCIGQPAKSGSAVAVAKIRQLTRERVARCTRAVPPCL